MAKKRKFNNKMKKRVRFSIILLILMIIISIGAYYYLKNNELTVLNDTTAPPNHKNFLGYDYYINGEDVPQEFVFVSDKSTNIDNYFTKTLYTYKNSAGIQHYKGNYVNLLAGKSCDRQQLVRFVYCDNNYDKSACKVDIFDNLWLINSLNDYPNFAEYYTGKSEGFFYSYSCYESEDYFAITVPDDVENKYLYNSKCINSKDSNWVKGDNYNTEKECLEALAIQLEAESQPTCTYKLYDDEFVCKTNNLYQKERSTSTCKSDFTKLVERCDYGCEYGACKPVPVTICTYKEYDEFKCIDGVNYQKVQERDCSEGFNLPIDSCTITSTDITDTTDTTDTKTTTQDNTTINLGEDTDINGIECRGYENIINTPDNRNICSFDIMKTFSNQGLSDLWEDFSEEIMVVLGLIAVMLVIIFAPKITGGNRR